MTETGKWNVPKTLNGGSAASPAFISGMFAAEEASAVFQEASAVLLEASAVFPEASAVLEASTVLLEASAVLQKNKTTKVLSLAQNLDP